LRLAKNRYQQKEDLAMILLKNKIILLHKEFNQSFVKPFVFSLALSWIYAASSQIIIPLPFNLVPISIQPLPLLLVAHFFGWKAVSAYGLYLLQGALGFPFFAGCLGGIGRLMGPTGGYLFGFGLAMMFVAMTQTFKSKIACFVRILSSAGIYFLAGLLQLSLFVPMSKLFATGLYPFLVGDCLKLVIFFLVLFSDFVFCCERA